MDALSKSKNLPTSDKRSAPAIVTTSLSCCFFWSCYERPPTLFLAKNNVHADFQSIAPLKLGITMQPLPTLLFRYRSVGGLAQARTQRIVETGLHYFASPTSFNDPFDSRPNFTLDADEAAVRDYLNGMWARQAPHLSEEQRQAEVDAILRDPSRDPRIPEKNTLFATTYDSLESMGVRTQFLKNKTPTSSLSTIQASSSASRACAASCKNNS